MSISQHPSQPPLSPAILEAADQIVQWIERERTQAIAATQKAHEEVINQQRRNIEQLELSLQTSRNELEQATSNLQTLVEGHNRDREDLTFLCSALDEMGMFLSMTVDEETGVWTRKLVLHDGRWREFLRGLVDSKPVSPLDNSPGDSSKGDTTITPEYASITKDEPIQAVLALKVLQDVILRDTLALTNAQASYMTIKKEHDDQRAHYESQIASLNATITSMQPPKFISPSKLLQGMQSAAVAP